MFQHCKAIGCTMTAVRNADFCIDCQKTHHLNIYKAPSAMEAAVPAVTAEVTKAEPDMTTGEFTGGHVDYYTVPIPDPMSGGPGINVECGDLIEALGMDFNEGNAFKAIWRMCASRLGLKKKGHENGIYDAEKVAYYGNRMVVVEQRKQNT